MRKKKETITEDGEVLALEEIADLDSFENTKYISSGSVLLDQALGGGWGLGKICNIFGASGIGKSLMCTNIAIQFNRQYPEGKIYYLDTEAGYNKDFAASLGMDISKIEFVSAHTVEAFYDSLKAKIDALPEGTPCLYIVDSCDGLSSEAELARGINDGNFGDGKAKKFSEIMRRCSLLLKKTQTCLFLVSQVRDKLATFGFGPTYTVSGGNALVFYSSQRVRLENLGKLNKQIGKFKEDTGNQIKATVLKSRFGPSNRVAKFNLLNYVGIDDLESCLSFLGEHDQLDRLPFAGGLKQINAIINRMDKMPEDDFNDAYIVLENAVKQYYEEYQSQFKVVRRKRTRYS